MADSQTLDRRGMDRRKFIGAAAGAAAAGATLAGPWSSAKKAWADDPDVPPCSNSYIPAYRHALQTFNLPASYWLSSAAFGTWTQMCAQVGCRAWEPAGQNVGYYSQIANFGGAGPVGNSMNMWAAAGSVTKAAGIRLVGDHGGPTAADANLTNIGILKANRWTCDSWGNGGGNPAFSPGATSTAQWNTLTSQIGLWQGAADTMNLYGLRFQHGFNLDDVGPMGELAPCQRYYRHFHGEGWGFVFNTGTLYDGHYNGEIYFNECDPSYAYGQVDIAWAVDGLSLGRGGPAAGTGTYPAPAANQTAATTLNLGSPLLSANLEKIVAAYPGGIRANVQFIPDIMERWQDRMPSWHTKDIGTAANAVPSVPVGLGTSPNGIGSNSSLEGVGNGFQYPGNPAGTAFGSPSLYGELPPQTSQDTSPFPEIFNRLRNPACHYYIVENDSASATINSQQYWPKHLMQCYKMLRDMQLDRSYIRQNWPGQNCVTGITNTSALPAYTPQNPTPGNSFAGPLDSRVPSPLTAGAQPGYKGADDGTALSVYLPTVTPQGPKATSPSTGPAAAMRYPLTYWADASQSGTPTYTPVRPPDTAGAPVNCGAPVITGSGIVASTLKVTDTGSWDRKPGQVSYFCYRWLVNGRPVTQHGVNGPPSNACAGGETCSCCGGEGKTYKVLLEDSGKTITCEVSCNNGQGATPVLTNGIIAVAGPGPELVQSPKVNVKKNKITIKGATWTQKGTKSCSLQRGPSSTGPWTNVASPYLPACPADDDLWFRTTCSISNDMGSNSASSAATQYTFCP